jgi:hypothetical protein
MLRRYRDGRSAVKKCSVTIYCNRKTNGAHSRQIFTGFCELARSGAIDLGMVEQDWNPDYETENLIKVTVNGDMDLLFDTNDGFYWIHDSVDRNIDYFAERILPRFRYVFKRSCDPQMVGRFGDAAAKFQPLGLNYDVTSPCNAMDRRYYGWRDQLKKRVKRSAILCRALDRVSDRLFHIQNFEHPPLPPPPELPPRILLLTRLWDPVGEEVGSVAATVRESGARDRNSINRVRIECLEACRTAFAGHFTGGLSDTPYARRIAPHLIAAAGMTDKQSYMHLVKSSQICVASTGLHLSTGWRLGEYVAASRAIVSEKIHDDLPGDFRVGRNYLEFSTADELVGAIQRLVADRSLMSSLMWNNHGYYRAHVRPDSLVLNALLKALV